MSEKKVADLRLEVEKRTWQLQQQRSQARKKHKRLQTVVAKLAVAQHEIDEAQRKADLAKFQLDAKEKEANDTTLGLLEEIRQEASDEKQCALELLLKEQKEKQSKLKKKSLPN